MRLLLLALSVLLAFSRLLAQSPPSVLMISVDGMRPDYVTRADEHGLHLPVLRSFLRDGVYADGVMGVFPTVTYPSHTTLVTGVWPAQHGIVNNQRFDPERKMDGAWFWYEDQIKVPTLWSAAHAAGLSTASVGWPATADARDIDTLIPEYWRSNVGEPTNPDDRYLMNALSRPDDELNRIAARTGTAYMEGNDTSPAGDEVKTVYALDILKQHKPKFMTLHLSSLDEEEHLHGPFSKEANADIERIDGMIGRLIQQEHANDPNAVIVIVSDHGFADFDKMVNLGEAFVEAGLIHLSTDGTSVINWQAEPWALGGMFAIMLHNPADTVVKERVRSLLQQLAARPTNGIEDVLDASAVARLGGVPKASFVVTLRKGYACGAGLRGDLITTIPGHHGTHGYNPQTTPEMRASFFAEGANIPRGRDLGLVDMRSIAPTIAHLLGVTLTDAQQPALVQ